MDTNRLNAVDAQALELWTRSCNEIAKAFSIPPTIIGELERGTWSNSVQLASQFLKFCLSKWMVQFENEVRNKLLKPSERGQYVVAFDTDQLLKSDLLARAQSYTQLIGARILNPNECREKEGLPPYEGGDEFVNPNTTSMSLDTEDAQDGSQPGDSTEDDPADQPPKKRARNAQGRFCRG